MLKTAVLHILFYRLLICIDVHFDLWISTVSHWILRIHILRKQSALVEVLSLLHVTILLIACIELDHHCSIQLLSIRIHSCCIYIIKCHNARL